MQLCFDNDCGQFDTAETVQPSKDSAKTGKEMFPYRSRFR